MQAHGGDNSEILSKFPCSAIRMTIQTLLYRILISSIAKIPIYRCVSFYGLYGHGTPMLRLTHAVTLQLQFFVCHCVAAQGAVAISMFRSYSCFDKKSKLSAIDCHDLLTQISQ